MVSRRDVVGQKVCMEATISLSNAKSFKMGDEKKD